MSNEEGWSAAPGDPYDYLNELPENYQAARRSIAQHAKDIDEEFKLLDQLGLM